MNMVGEVANAATTAKTATDANTTLSMQDSIDQTKAAMGQAIATNAAITELTIRFQVAMQGINATREAATEAYKKAGEANNSMHQ
jgi:hypothetical protein